MRMRVGGMAGLGGRRGTGVGPEVFGSGAVNEGVQLGGLRHGAAVDIYLAKPLDEKLLPIQGVVLLLPACGVA